MDSQEHDSLAELQNFIKKDNFPQLEGYEIQREIGKGGFGVVYLANQTALQREVAIKMIFSNQSNAMAYKRFVAEAQTIARLKHLGIAEVYDFINTQDGKYFMIMEYLPGKGLEEAIADNEISIKEAVKITRDIAEILGYSHGENVIHRDIKPSNIRIDVNGNTKLLDFGLARVNEGLSTITGTVIGTPQYMPPEQAQGSTDIDIRSDIYSLGVVMYEMLTGNPPFSGNNIATIIYQAVHGELKKPSTVNRFVDDQLETICLKAMAREPQQRYQTVEEMRKELERYLDEHQPSQSVASQISCIQQSVPPFKIKVWVTAQDQQKNNFAIGEKIQIHFESEQDCYLYLVNIGPTQDVTVLYPNEYIRENYIKANTTYSFPRKEDDFEFELQDPPGEEMIYVLGSVEPLDDVWGIDWQKIDSAFLQIPRKTSARNIGIIAKKMKQQPSKNWSSCKYLLKKCQERKMDRNIVIKPKNSKSQEKRVALVIGNGNYEHAPLRNPQNDAEDISEKLRKLQFEVIVHIDANIEVMRVAIEEFHERLSSSGIALFYYAGHGMQVKNKNFLIPTESQITKEYQIPHRAIDLGEVLGAMESARSKMNMVFLDACRNNPFARSFRSATRGLAQMDAPDGSLIVYATSPGKIAIDGEERNGVFTKHLLHYIEEPLEISTMLKRVRKSVKRETNNEQIPWESSCIDDDFYLSVSQAHYTSSTENKTRRTSEKVIQSKPQIVKTREIVGFTYKGTRTYSVGGVSNTIDEYVHKETGLEFVKIPAGSFIMGSDQENNYCKPEHKVFLREYLFSKYVVTQGVWKKVMENEPWKGNDFVKEGERYPAVYVSWEDAIGFCEKTGLSLPSEAQWEYACRAGTTSKYYWGKTVDHDYLWYKKNTRSKGVKYAQQVGLKKANGYGLYDMLGNVWEWCEDAWHDNYENAPLDCSTWKSKTSDVSFRVIRGGCFGIYAVNCSSAYRCKDELSNLSSDLGIRLCQRISCSMSN